MTYIKKLTAHKAASTSKITMVMLVGVLLVLLLSSTVQAQWTTNGNNINNTNSGNVGVGTTSPGYVTAAIAVIGLSLAGWVVDWAAGGIQQDRVFFVAGAGASNLVSQVQASGRFSHGTNPRSEHGDYTSSYRQGFHPSLQLSFTTDGRRLDADLDSFNPQSGLFGFLGHAVEYFSHNVGRILGGSGKTNPYNVGFRSTWECK